MRTLPILMVVLMTSLPTAVSAAEGPDRIISVTGEGKATVPPDMATVQTGVVTEAATAREALDANNKAMKDVLGVLKRHGIADRDVQTTNFYVQPIHKRDDQGRTLPEIVGYRISNEVRAKVRQLDKVGDVLDALVKAGSNQISGVAFGVANPEQVMDTARERAIADARRRAQVYARAAGVQVGAVRTISEEPVHFPQPQRFARAAMAEAAAVPIATGEEEFRVRVQVVFAMKEE
jgi:uncharacterized protein YggE